MDSDMDAFLFLIVVPTSGGPDSLSFPFLLLMAGIQPTQQLLRFCPLTDSSPESVGAAVITLWPAAVPFPAIVFWESNAETAQRLVAMIRQKPRLRDIPLAIYDTGSAGIVHEVEGRLEMLAWRVATGDNWAKRIPLANLICGEPLASSAEPTPYPDQAPPPMSMPAMRGFLRNDLVTLHRSLRLLHVATATEIFIYVDLCFRSLL